MIEHPAESIRTPLSRPRSRPSRRAEKLAPYLWVLLGTLLIVARWNHLVLRPIAIPPDFASYALGAQILRNGEPNHLYITEPTAEYGAAMERALAVLGTHDPITPYVYPPLFAKVITWLPWTTWKGFFAGWFLVMAAALWGGYFIALRLVPEIPMWMAAVLATLFAVFFECSSQCMWLGQITPLMLFLVSSAFYLDRNGNPTAAGACLALAIFLKITPAILLIAWGAFGARKLVRSTLATLAALALASIAIMGWPAHVTYVSRLQDAARWSLPSFNSHSFQSFLLRFFVRDRYVLQWEPQSEPLAVKIMTGIALACAFFGFVLVIRAARRERDPRAALSMALVLMLLFSTFSWTHYAVFLVPGYVLLSDRLRAMRTDLLVVLGIGVALLLAQPLIPATPPTLYDKALMSGYTVIYLVTTAALAVWGFRSSRTILLNPNAGP